MKSSFFRFVSKMADDGQQFQLQSQRLSLKIDNLHVNHMNTGVLTVLESCPKLETLQIHEVTKKKSLPRSSLSMSDDLNCDLLQLKMVGLKISVSIDEINVNSCQMLMLIRILWL